MSRRNTSRVEKRHGERLAALDSDLAQRRYFTALESTKWILGDKTIPPAMRLEVTLKEVRALLGIGRSGEAAARLCAAIKAMHHRRLYDQRDAVEEVIGRVELARGPDKVGGLGC